MKEYPILFSVPMVQAILDGEKTQTRRPFWLNVEINDFLYVRETFSVLPSGKVVYRADQMRLWPEQRIQIKYKPSIHMPRKYSRLFLKISDVRKEHLWNMTEEDAWAEGMEMEGLIPEMKIYETARKYGLMFEDSRTTFAALWDSMYAGKGLGWNKNPEIQVIEFELRNKDEPA